MAFQFGRRLCPGVPFNDLLSAQGDSGALDHDAHVANGESRPGQFFCAKPELSEFTVEVSRSRLENVSIGAPVDTRNPAGRVNPDVYRVDEEERGVGHCLPVSQAMDL